MELDTTKFYVRQPLKKKKTTLEPEYIVWEIDLFNIKFKISFFIAFKILA